jgi:hypothetical protein
VSQAETAVRQAVTQNKKHIDSAPPECYSQFTWTVIHTAFGRIVMSGSPPAADCVRGVITGSAIQVRGGRQARR